MTQLSTHETDLFRIPSLLHYLWLDTRFFSVRCRDGAICGLNKGVGVIQIFRRLDLDAQGSHPDNPSILEIQRLFLVQDFQDFLLAKSQISIFIGHFFQTATLFLIPG